MAGTTTITYSETRTIKKVSFDWLSDASGDADPSTKALSGELLRVVIAPDGGGTAPTALYDLVLNDENGIDVLQGAGANLSATVTTEFFPALTNGTDGNSTPTAFDGVLQLVVSNAGNAKGGNVYCYFR